MKSKLARYPVTFSKILLALPANGTPIEIPLNSNADALDWRLKFYNFLKFLRRNPGEATHFQGRHNLVVASVHGNILRFNLRDGSVPTELEAGFEEALRVANIPGSFDLPASMLPDDSASVNVNTFLPSDASCGLENPFDHLDEDKPK